MARVFCLRCIFKHMNVDYIVVGLGLAGLAFTKELQDHNKSFIVFEDSSQNASVVAGGVYNPVILKRFTPVWNATSQLEIALPFYAEIEKQLKKQYDYKVDICRIFKSIEEQNNWFVACDKPLLAPYMIPKVIANQHSEIIADFGYGKLTNTGRIDTKALLNDYTSNLSEKAQIIKESFNYNALSSSENNISYKSIIAKNIVFCEGFGLHKNPFFNYLPMQEAKGELLMIHAPNLQVDFLIKAAVFVLPMGNHYYKVGATFNWKDKTQSPSEEGRNELVEKLNTFIKTPYTIVEHIAGIRPTVKDRRPLVGVHPKHKNIAILNGLGTRGVMIAPVAAKALYNCMEHNMAIDSELSITRF